MRTPFDSELQDRLMRYAAIDSQSDEASASQPSTACQLDMSRLLVAELDEMGAKDVRLTDYGVVLATVPATVEGPVMGLCAHVDTAPQFNATGVKPRLIRGTMAVISLFLMRLSAGLGPIFRHILKNVWDMI